MTLQNAIEKFKLEYNSNTDDNLLTDWMSYLDNLIHSQIFSQYEETKSIPFSAYTYSENVDTPLLVCEPYSVLYIHFLAMKDYLYRSDITRYNNASLLYTSSYRDFEKYCNKEYTHIKITNNFNV